MQSEAPQAPNLGSERLVAQPNQMGGRVPELPPLDTGIEQGTADRREQMAEAAAAVSDASSVATAPVEPVAASKGVDTQAVTGGAISNTPVSAADEDLIEKEWVDKAKQIVAATQDDPHARTNQVNQLQRDYLMKRYGRQIGTGQ